MALKRPNAEPAVTGVLSGDTFLIDGSSGVRALAATAVPLLSPSGVLQLPGYGIGNLVSDAGGNVISTTGGIPGGNPGMYDTKALAVAATISSVVIAFRTNGFYTPGDGGGGLFIRKTALDAGAFGFASADGAYWQLVPDTQGFISVKQTGAKGDGATRDDLAINIAYAASTAVSYPPGQYMLDGPLLARTGTVSRGLGFEKTRLSRRGVWSGDTLMIGYDAPGGVGSSGNFEVSGLLFEQLHPGFVQGDATNGLTMTDRLTGGQAHLRVWGGSLGLVRSCWFQGAQFGIDIQGTTNLLVEHNFFNGSYDQLNPNVSETYAYIRVRNTVNQGFATLPAFRNNYLAGGPLVSRSYTYGSATYTLQGNGGALYGIIIEGAEGLKVSGGYIGGQNRSCVLVNPTGSGIYSLTTNLSFSDIFVDGAETCNFEFTQSAAGRSANIVNIHDIGFNGQLACEDIMIVDNPNAECVLFGLNFCNNVGQAHIKSPFLLRGLGGGRFLGNQIAAYNARGGYTSASPDGSAAALISGQSHDVYFDSNTWGGGINSFGGANNCAYGPYFTGAFGKVGLMEQFKLGLGGGGPVGGLTTGAAAVYS